MSNPRDLDDSNKWIELAEKEIREISRRKAEEELPEFADLNESTFFSGLVSQAEVPANTVKITTQLEQSASEAEAKKRQDEEAARKLHREFNPFNLTSEERSSSLQTGRALLPVVEIIELVSPDIDERLTTSQKQFIARFNELGSVDLLDTILPGANPEDELTTTEIDAKKNMLALAKGLFVYSKNEIQKIQAERQPALAAQKLLEATQTFANLRDDSPASNRYKKNAAIIAKCNAQLNNIIETYDVTAEYLNHCIFNHCLSKSEFLRDPTERPIREQFAALEEKQPSRRLRNCLLGMLGAGLVTFGVATILLGGVTALGLSGALPPASFAGLIIGSTLIKIGVVMTKIGLGAIGVTAATAAVSSASLVSGTTLFARAFKPSTPKEYMQSMREQEYHLPKVKRV